MTEEQFRSVLLEYREEIRFQIAQHSKLRGLDGTLYNYTTGVVLLCTALLSTLPGAEGGFLFWFMKSLAVLSMFLVALDRTLGFGPRWRFHIEMENSYRTLLDHLLILETVEPMERGSRLDKFRGELSGVRSREHGLPGISTADDNKAVPTKVRPDQ
ncbi:hypothetical protein [Aromatoleum petrolei]|uniref:SMODS and SLOG-associating 2TM effector domain-containing protein n=1 Tax=Aromatoleum petrolei TaxID=76116 RepID=A0ABX1MLX4_9RHOO|nr:hypothetical protein [Aromatoleum petrolei]NMF88191.1 hypothetical protein [Aromatoleum petrolei]